MKRIMTFLVALCLTFSLSACGVSQADYDALKEENASLKDQVESLQSDVKQLTVLNDYLEKQLEELNPDEETSTTETNSPLDEYIELEKESDGPSELELMSYSQTVLEDFFPKCKYSRNESDYKFVKTNMRYKIEGAVSVDSSYASENFYMIIQFLDEKYETYDLISLQVGNDVIYKSQTSD